MFNQSRAVAGLGLLFSISAHSTIYMADVEPTTGSVGMMVISSGPVATYQPSPMTGKKGVGFVGWSGEAANIKSDLSDDVLELMRQGASVDRIESIVDQQIHNLYSRFMFVSVSGTFGYVFPPYGCSEPDCDVLVDSDRM